MSSIQEQFAAATKAHFEAQLQMINSLTSKMFEGVEKVIELNVNAAKTSMEEVSDAAKAIGTAKDPQAFLSSAATQLQPAAEKALDYGRRLTAIAESVQPEFSKAAETQLTETRKKLAALVDEAAKNAPAGSESTIAIMQSIVGNADAGYEQLMKNVKQAIETLQTNVKNATEQISKASENAVKAGKK
jgi:phasin family protein